MSTINFCITNIFILIAFNCPVYAISCCDELNLLLSHIDSFRGDFEQKVGTESGDVIQENAGIVHFKKPRCFRWELKKLDEFVLITNNKLFWNYDKGLKQVIIQNIRDNDSIGIIPLLSGDFSLNYKNYIINKEECNRSNDKCFKLTSISHDLDWQWIQINFKESLLNEILILDKLEQLSITTFTNVKVNISINNDIFILRIPNDVEVIDNSR